MAREHVQLRVRAFADRSVEYALRSGESSAVHWRLFFLLVAAWRAATAVVEESLLLVPSLGVKLSTRRRNGAVSVRFLDQSDICAVILNEAIVFNDVVYYLAFMVEGQDSMVLAYEAFRPRVAVLQQIFCEVKGALFPDNDGDGATRRMRLPSSIAVAAAAASPPS
ncbi:hypothetical protein PybrP1_007708 [[Pythium] brassicae (nom. inval.)]|nr:hypothetical protein PybrP1_007708 [[Pythium] brassicae (nom. inval.)]